MPEALNMVHETRACTGENKITSEVRYWNNCLCSCVGKSLMKRRIRQSEILNIFGCF